MTWAAVAGQVASSVIGSALGGGEKRPSYRPYMKAMGLPKGAGLMDAKKLEIATDWQARMDAAKKHGIHPLHALGVNVQTTSPVAHVGQSGNPSLGNAIAQGGSEIARAVSAGQSTMEKLQERLLLAQIQGQEIDNVSRASMVARTFSAPGTGPGIPDGRLGTIEQSVGVTSARNRGLEYMTSPANKIYVGYDGNPIITPSQEFAESLEGNWPIGMAQNFIHNTVPFYTERLAKRFYGRFLKNRWFR